MSTSSFRLYDDAVYCANCETRRPLRVMKWTHFPKPDAEGRAGEWRCPPVDARFCEQAKEYNRKLREGGHAGF